MRAGILRSLFVTVGREDTRISVRNGASLRESLIVNCHN
jgi:hypothetical protein